MAKVVDFHVHVFPDPFQGHLPLPQKANEWRKQARAWMKPISSSIHSIQTLLRYLPPFARKNLDELGSLVPLPSLILESTPADLKEAMDEAKVDYALTIAHPGVIPNEFVMELCAQDPRLIPVVNISKGIPKPGLALKKYVEQGAKVLKIHAAADGDPPDSPRYKTLLKTATDLGIPIILHTGCVHMHLVYKNPELGRVTHYTKWFEAFPKTQFVLAHMNLHDPGAALDLCEEYENLWVDTSWQPMEIIAEAARRIGAERVLFGTDWPLVGNNLLVGRKRIDECVETGLLNEDQAKLILGENAVKLLGLSDNGS